MKTYTWRMTDEMHVEVTRQAAAVGLDVKQYLESLIAQASSLKAVSPAVSETATRKDVDEILGKIAALQAAVSQQSQTATSSLPAVSEQSDDDYEGVEPPTIEYSLYLVDRMPADGDETNPHSRFQIRRRKQMEVLRRAWSATFPEQNKLIDATVKKWLTYADNSAARVFEAMQATEQQPKKIAYPLTYIEKILVAGRDERLKREAIESAPVQKVIHIHDDAPGIHRREENEQEREDRLEGVRSLWERARYKYNQASLLEAYGSADKIPPYGCRAEVA